jgi:hypothetical protein
MNSPAKSTAGMAATVMSAFSGTDNDEVKVPLLEPAEHPAASVMRAAVLTDDARNPRSLIFAPIGVATGPRARADGDHRGSRSVDDE